MEQELKRKTNERMAVAIDSLKKEFSSIRTGRASLAFLDGIMVNYYGSITPLQQLSSLSIPESRQIAIQPWDPKIIPDKEKHLSEDNVKRFHDEIQKLTDSYISKVDEILNHKEKEIMEV